MRQMQLYKVIAWVGDNCELNEKLIGLSGDDIENVRSLVRSAMHVLNTQFLAIKTIEYIGDVYFDEEKGK